MKVANISIDFNEKNFSDLVGQLNVFMTSIGLENMNGQVINNINIPASTSIDIPHSLKTTPKYRIILRQINGGTIVDGDTQWSDTLISLKNTGATDTIISVFVMRG